MHIGVFSVGLFIVLYGGALAMLAAGHRVWWRRPWVRRTAATTLLAYLAFAGITWIGVANYAITHLSVAALAAIYVSLAWVVLGLGLAGVGRAALVLWYGRGPGRSPARPGLDRGRRDFLRGARAIGPVAALGASARGLAGADGPIGTPVLHVGFPELPDPLCGLRILHLSDAHLGLFVHLEELEQAMTVAARHQPDLVAVTGDMCDYVPVYAEVLGLITALRPRLGVWACLGNHEHYGDLRAVRACYAACGIPLLVNEGHTLAVGSSKLHIGGTDDPKGFLGEAVAARLRESVRLAQSQCPADAFALLLSHRAQALNHAAPLGVGLVLSGHTHGLQVGLGGRSLLEPVLPFTYPWGLYRRGSTQLCTTSGMGHWLPFRLGCPRQAPLLVLERGSVSTLAKEV